MPFRRTCERASCPSRVLWYALCVIAAISIVATDGAEHSVRIGLHAEWHPTSLAAEAAEWIWLHDHPTRFWSFLQHVEDAHETACVAQSAALCAEAAVADAALAKTYVNARADNGDDDHASRVASVALTAARWATSARFMSPRVHAAMAAAHDSLLIDRGVEHDNATAVDPSFVRAPVFAVVASRLSTTCHVVQDASEVAATVAGASSSAEGSPAADAAHSSCAKHGLHASELTVTQPGDHEFRPDTECARGLEPPVVVVLYVAPSSRGFSEWHRKLAGLASECTVSYIVRFWEGPQDSEAKPRPPVALQGFVVEAALKSTEYKVIDDVAFEPRLFPDAPYSLEISDPAKPPPVNADRDVTVDASVDTTAFENGDCGLAAATYIVSHAAGDPRAALGQIVSMVEDLPVTLPAAVKFAATDDAKVPLSTVRVAARRVHTALAGTEEAIYINGRQIRASELFEDYEHALTCIASYAHISTCAAELMTGANAQDSLSSRLVRVRDIIGMEDTSGDFAKLRYDYTMAGKYAHVALWFNDLSKDDRYRSWIPSIEHQDGGAQAFIEAVSAAEADGKAASPEPGTLDPAGLVRVRSNLAQLTLVVDMGSSDIVKYFELPESILRHELAMQIALVPVPNGRPAILAAASLYHCLDVGGLALAMQYLSMFRRIIEFLGGGFREVAITSQVAELVYQQTAQAGAEFEHMTSEEIVRGDAGVRKRLRATHEWAVKFGVIPQSRKRKEWDPVRELDEPAEAADTMADSFSALGLLNGVLLDDIGLDAVNVAIEEQRRIAGLLRDGIVKPDDGAEKSEDAAWMVNDDSLLFVPRMPRREATPSAADLADGAVFASDNADGSVDALTVDMLNGHMSDIRALQYIHVDSSREEAAGTTRHVTLWIVPVAPQSDAVVRAQECVSRMLASGAPYARVLRTATLGADTALARALLTTISPDDGATSASDVVFVLNGRVYTQAAATECEDLVALVARESVSVSAKVAAAHAPHVSEDDVLVGLSTIRDVDAACEDGAASAAQRRQGGRAAKSFSKVLELLQSAGDSDAAGRNPLVLVDETAGARGSEFIVTAVLNPLGKHALPVASFLRALAAELGDDQLSLRLVLLPTINVPSDGPGRLRPVFARYSIRPQLVARPLADTAVVFDRLPQRMLLTFAVVPPRAWFIAPAATNFDMDNIVLDDLPADVPVLHAEYALQSLLVEGSCVDQALAPPQGLRLEMSRAGAATVDTIVMANLGYFQLKVPFPGRWEVAIAPGRGRALYTIRRMATQASLLGGSRVQSSAFEMRSPEQWFARVESLYGVRGSLLFVARTPGTEDTPLLDASRGAEGAPRPDTPLSRISKRLRALGRGERLGADTTGTEGTSQGIHVFSVASGHLYERFLKIMMLSVTAHASEPVTFWVLENFLSPGFKKVIQLFAAEHGFAVRMVTYRWPHWLREQTEKQRVLWAYKILFLDVLFPLSLRRVIFVDSDQVVRGDLAELMRMDLKGAPYGYVPFCESRKEVEGFRFWKSGFWKDTLRDAKYHISALYVVDLDAFRESSAGDSLRFMYQSLSADPNSLANLDQDLPNYAAVVPVGGSKEVVRIFDLPQEWLWCETWCDDASKERAKTIDLCNNPMTKEPKLKSAKRIIAEWVDLDARARETTQRIHAAVGRAARGNDTEVTRQCADGDRAAVEHDEL